ncbi:MAG TPA: enolase C-terminal domain-like protein [Solirubrobacterales bacterium]
MRIERVETIPYALRFREPYVTARGRLERREMVLLRVRTAEGVEGLGEAVPLSLRGGATLEEVERALSDAATRLVGLELDTEREPALDLAIATFLELARPKRLPPPAAAALECAIFDLAAKADGKPLWALLGADEARPVRCNATLTAGAPEGVAEQARSWAERGFRTLKLKLGAGDDVEVVRAVRAAVGPEARIRVDANEAWSVRDAERVLAELEPLGIELAEQPVSGLRALAKLSRSSAIPLAADEAVNSVADAHRARQRRACAYVTAKLSKVGGIGAANAIAEVIPTYLSSALDGPVGIAAAAHAAQIIPDAGVDHGLATQRLFAEGVAARECELDGPMLSPPAGPGLGVEIDDEALQRARLA